MCTHTHQESLEEGNALMYKDDNLWSVGLWISVVVVVVVV